MKKYISPLLLLITAIIWGLAFVAQKAASVMPPFALSALRSIIAVAALIPITMFFDKLDKNGRHLFSKNGIDIKRIEVIGGILCGSALFIASNLQQFGINGTDAGKASFITALYVVIVPIYGLFLHRRASLNSWIGVGISVIGFYLLCIKDGFSIDKSDMLVLLCTFAFAAQIMIIDHYLPSCDSVRLSLVQFATVTVISLIFSFIFEGKGAFLGAANCIPEIIYLGLGSSGIAYTLQIIGQKKTHPAAASIILSLESVFGALMSALILHERLLPKEYLGAAIVFLAVIVSQLDFSFLKKKEAKSRET